MRYTVLLLSVMNTTINLTAAATTATTHYYCLPLSTTFYFSCLKLNTQPTHTHKRVAPGVAEGKRGRDVFTPP